MKQTPFRSTSHRHSKQIFSVAWTGDSQGSLDPLCVIWFFKTLGAEKNLMVVTWCGKTCGNPYCNFGSLAMACARFTRWSPQRLLQDAIQWHGWAVLFWKVKPPLFLLVGIYHFTKAQDFFGARNWWRPKVRLLPHLQMMPPSGEGKCTCLSGRGVSFNVLKRCLIFEDFSQPAGNINGCCLVTGGSGTLQRNRAWRRRDETCWKGCTFRVV